jgi:protein O-mannosyl-transferase
MFASVIAVLSAVYANSFDVPWLYDDFPNIVHNDAVQPADCQWHHLISSLRSMHGHQVVSRPLAYFSIALNYCFGGLNPRGYHIVNFVIHVLTALCLFLFIRALLRLPSLQRRYEDSADWIAWLAVLLWAVHPIQVTAVTLIVQRMTAMAGLFYVSALYFYVRGKCAGDRWRRRAAYGLSIISAACAMLSKENAVLLLFVIPIADWFFFRPVARPSRKRLLFYVALLGLAGMISLLYLDPLKAFQPYPNRPFSMSERLMTQPRVLFQYLALLAVPTNTRMAILHDIEYSTSLLEPWTTLPALLGLIAALGTLLWLMPRHRLLAFCGLFFFINHALESSFLNLELIYEHRNYIPSMLLFVPLAVAGVRTAAFFRYRRPLQFMIGGLAGLILLSNAHATWTYNSICRSELSFWIHTVHLSPNLSTARGNLGKVYWNLGDSENAFEQNCAALETDRYNNLLQKAGVYYNLGLYQAYAKNDPVQAVDYLRKALFYSASEPKFYHELIKNLITAEDYASAGDYTTEGLRLWPQDRELLKLKGYQAMAAHRFEQAIEAVEELLSVSPDDRTAVMLLAQSHRGMGRYEKAIELLSELADSESPTVAALAAMALVEIGEETARNQIVNAALCRLKKMNLLQSEISLQIDRNLFIAYFPDMASINRAVQREKDRIQCN